MGADTPKASPATPQPSSAEPVSNDIPPPGIPVKFAFGVGSSSESIFYIAFNLFCFFYFVQVLGLPPNLAGIAAAIALVFDAISDPLIGYMSDRWKWGKLGRRHPFMFAAAVPLGLFWTALFNPPPGLEQWGLFFWLMGFSILSRISQTIFYVPHMAMGGEFTSDYEERSKVFAWHVIFLWAGGASVHYLGLRYFFASDSEHLNASGEAINGMLVAENYSVYGIVWAGVMMAIILFSTVFTMSRIPYLNTDQRSGGDGSADNLQPPSLAKFLAGLWAELLEVLQNRNFRFLVAGLFAAAIGSGVYETLSSHNVNYIWQLTTDQYSMISFSSMTGFILGFLFITKLHVAIGRRVTLAISMVVTAIGNSVPMLLLLLGAPIQPGSDLAFATIMIGTGVYYTGQSGMLVTIVALIGDIADEHELNTGKRREGILYSSRTLFSKVSSAFGHLLAGILLSVIQFPLGKDVNPGEVPEPIVFEFMLIYVFLVPIPPLIAGVLYLQQRITQQSHLEVLRQLRLRREQQ